MAAASSTADKRTGPDLLSLVFEMIAETGWHRFSFSDLAERADLTLSDIRKVFSGRSAVLDRLSTTLDEAMLAIDRGELDDLPPRDRVFELIMRRLEAMAPFRAGLLRLMKEARREPELLLMTACRLDRSIAWLQDASGLRAEGLRARVQRRLLTAVYLRTLSVWSSDESADLAKTMASLDKQLRRIEGFAGLADAAPTSHKNADAA